MTQKNENIAGEAREEYQRWNSTHRAHRYMKGGKLLDFEDLPVIERNKWMKIVLLRKQNQGGDLASMQSKKRKIWAKEEKEFKDKDLG